jgi:hypothetical protein
VRTESVAEKALNLRIAIAKLLNRKVMLDIVPVVAIS